ncbi:glycine cleavage system transcriptional repressor [Jiangella alkaliphila]|uniref:Glycine cleavage system transcriptional repressor n=1 Tax=Jiangella alkaliphila TaxID=419479 RepID=A0A1H2J540_9ACTN|nr:ACT domain-containing protein [Jiangella alkaliphila]SDU51547.1 glycine cleavage system transcriptional repressor [Jiangella alkaliphila]
MEPVSLIAVTVIGHDRPGIIADATAGLAGLGLNLEDSTMTLLRGHFAMMLICSGDRSPAEVQQALAGLAADGRLQVSAAAVPDEDGAGSRSLRPYVLTVHGGDRPGIVSAVTGVLAEAGGNITDLTTRLTGDLYVAIAEVDLPADADADAVGGRLRDAGAELGVGVTLRPQETDVL